MTTRVAGVHALRFDSAVAQQPHRDDVPEDEAADVREEGDAAAVRLRREEPEVRFDQLVEEPEAEVDVGRNLDEEDQRERLDTGVRVEDGERTEHRRNRAARPEIRNLGRGVRAEPERHRRLQHRGREATGEVEEEVLHVPVGVLDVLPEDGEEQHVAEDVIPAAVHEHRSDPAHTPGLRPVARVVDRAGVEGRVVDGRVQVRQLVEDPDREVRHDQRDVHPREAPRTHAVRERNHSTRSLRRRVGARPTECFWAAPASCLARRTRARGVITIGASCPRLSSPESCGGTVSRPLFFIGQP
jgi:hypothetical protein